ncbi:hypothetical protein [Agaribacterium sp. ZY112]|uniref:hypothetical protein n=1 Tax=Agaribacterium sp. ZY112 TaxID=3233574 RepID=UPI0035237460
MLKKHSSLVHKASPFICIIGGALIGSLFTQITIGLALGTALGLSLAYALEQES